MKAANFRYQAPDTLDALLETLGEYGSEARIIAGGQSLMPMLNMRLAKPSVVVDITRIPDLAGISAENGVTIGATTRYATIEMSEIVATRLPLLAKAMPFIAHPAVRNRGTIGGSLGLADPAAEMPACCVCLDALIHIASRHRTRVIRAEEFFVGDMETAAAADEAIVAVECPPARPEEKFAFAEISRRHGDFALAGAAMRGSLDAGRFRNARMVLFGATARPTVSPAIRNLLESSTDVPPIEDFRAALAEDVDIVENNYSREFRLHLASVAARRAAMELQREFHAP